MILGLKLSVMLFDDSLFINIFIFTVMNVRSHFDLLPKQRHTASDTNVNVYLIMTFEYLFCLYEIGRMSLLIKSTTVEASPRHMDAPSTDREILISEVLVG